MVQNKMHVKISKAFLQLYFSPEFNQVNHCVCNTQTHFIFSLSLSSTEFFPLILTMILNFFVQFLMENKLKQAL